VSQDGILPIPPAYIFMIDVSYQSVKSGLVDLLCARIRSVLDDLPRYVVAVDLFLITSFYLVCPVGVRGNLPFPLSLHFPTFYSIF